MKSWEAAGKPVPPPHRIKQKVLTEYATNFETKILIETGTFLGDMLYAMRRRFDRLISIELSSELTERARVRFRKYPQIQIVNGDSGEKLKEILQGISQRTLFWLDGHYSGGITAKGKLDTPIYSELQIVFDHPVKDHVILIDDARLFNGTNDYPTIPELQEIIQELRPDYLFSVRNDIIRIHPPQTNLLLTV